MAANYWTSTQYKFWSFTPDKLADLRDDLEKSHRPLFLNHPYPDRRLMFLFLRERLLQLGKRLQFRQQCVATAMVYMHRYFLSNPMQNVNLYLLVATAFYLASKTEESPHHIRLVASEARQAWPDFVPGDVSRLGEMEFCLISEMRSQLIVWHPYRTLIELKENQDLKLNSDEVGLAWCIINDSYMTDLPLTCSPHLIAVIAVFLAIVLYPNTKVNGNRQLSSDMHLSMEPNTFPSMGGRPGMAGVLGSAMQGLPMNQASSLSSTTNGYSVGTPRTATTDRTTPALPEKANSAAAFQNSERFQNTVKFLIESEIDLKQMIEGTQEIVSLYEVHEQYHEGTKIKEAVARCLRANGLNG